MNFIRALFSSRQTELINLKKIEGAVIREKEIVGATGREYYYSDDPKMRNYIINFSEVEQILLNLFKE